MYEPNPMLVFGGVIILLMMYFKEVKFKERWVKYPRGFKVFWWSMFVLNGVGFGLFLDYYFW